MLKKIIALTLATLFTISVLMAQSQLYKISGQVLIGKDQPADNASIFVIRGKDKTRISTLMTNSSGHFRVGQLLPGMYTIEVSFVGYKVFKKNIEIGKADTSVMILLERRVDSLNEVTVKAIKPIIEFKPGLTIYNVSSDPAALGKSLSDVVAFMPGVAQNGSGALTVNGESDVTILINGRRSRINATDLVQQLQSANVERVELVSGADPRYASTTGSAVLNIILKKNREKTFTGNASFLTNNYGFLNASFRGSQSNGKRNIYFVLSDDEKFMQVQSSYIRKYEFADTIFFSGASKNNVHHSLRSFNAGIDLFIDSFNTINIENSLNIHSDAMRGQTNNRIGNILSANQVQTVIQSSPSEIENTIGVNYRKQFARTEKYFEADFSAAFFGLNSRRQFGKAEPADELKINSSAYQLKSEFFLPLSKGNSLLTGIDLSFIESVNLEKYINQSGNAKLDYSNKKAAIFSAFSYKAGKGLVIRPGVRIEDVNTIAKSSLANNITFSLLSLYPTLNIAWQINPKHFISLDYVRRINHPGLAEFYTNQNQPDTFQIHIGNASLIPVVRNNVSIDYRYKKGKANISLRVFANIVNNSIRMVTNFLTDNKIFTQLENIGDVYMYGGALTSQHDITKKWKLRFNANLNFSSLELKKKTYVKFLDFYDLNSMISNRYVFSENNDAEIIIRMMNYARNLNDDFSPGYNLSFQYNHKFKNKKWVMSLLANDILFTMKFRSVRYLAPNILSEQNFFSRSRFLQVVLNYKFGGDQRRREKKIQSERVLFSNG